MSWMLAYLGCTSLERIFASEIDPVIVVGIELECWSKRDNQDSASALSSGDEAST